MGNYDNTGFKVLFVFRDLFTATFRQQVKGLVWFLEKTWKFRFCEKYVSLTGKKIGKNWEKSGNWN